MAYQALYRVWRPQTFEDVIGQNMITTTLRNAVATKKVSHAYLFTGPRGTGKTSCAKILAKAVNCPHSKDGEPCNKCEICRAITDGSLNDVIEIDAASNNGVEQIRDIRDKAKYAPTQAEYKVYIIDEVHMLSQGAFNALLKTLEEPPAKVIFILATTEPQKIPATIISRTQRFDFRRIGPEDIMKRMEYILKTDHLEYDEQGLRLIAQAAEGGMRDALSILDQALSFGNDKLTLKNALQVTGTLDTQQLETYFDDLTAKDAAKSLDDLHAIIATGRSAIRFTDAIIEVCRDLLLVKADNKLLDSFDRSIVSDKILALKDSFSNDQLYQMIDESSQTQQSLRNANHTTIYLEVLTVKLIEIVKNEGNSAPVASDGKTTNELQKLQQQVQTLQTQLQQLENKPATIVKSKPMVTNNRPAKIAPAPATKTVEKPKVAHKKAHVNLKAIHQVLGNATRQDLNHVKKIWPDLMGMLSVTQRAVMKVSNPVAASDDGVVVAFDYAMWFERVDSDQEMMTMLKTNLDKLLKSDADVVIVAAEDWPGIRKDYIKHHLTDEHSKSNNDLEKKSENKAVKQAEKLFGKDIIDIKKD